MSSLVFETILFLLTLYKLYESIRGRCRRSIMRVILRDGTWAFSIIFGTHALPVRDDSH